MDGRPIRRNKAAFSNISVVWTLRLNDTRFFTYRMDSIKQFMEHHNVPHALQTRVKRWAHYAWSRSVISARYDSPGLSKANIR